MKNSIVVLTAVFGSLTLAACANSNKNSLIPNIPSSQRVNLAPTNAGETGVIVSGMPKNDLESLVAKNKNVRVRVINPKHGLYEIFGQNIAVVRNEVDTNQVLVEKNDYVPVPDETKEIEAKWIALKGANPPASPNVNENPLVTAIEKAQGVKLTGSNLDFVNSCQFNKSEMPYVDVTTNQGENLQKTMIYFDLGQSITLNGSSSHARSGSLSYQWLVTAPDDSLLPPTFSQSSQIQYTPDAMGMHLYSLVVKDSHGFCNAMLSQFYVSAKDPFVPVPYLPSSALAKIDPAHNFFWNIFYVGSAQSWKQAAGKDITIAVIDSGVNYNHPALQPNIWINHGEIPYNQIDDDRNGFVDDFVGYDFAQNDAYPFDDFGHGSHVAGIAASQLFGAARDARIMPIKATFIGGMDIATVVGAIEYAVDNGASVINMSVGWSTDYPVMRQAMRFAGKHNVLIVVAAGNDSANNDNVAEYPADYNYGNVVAVAATDRKNQLTFYSNYGVHNVQIAAPGGTADTMIWSAYKKNPRNLLFMGMAGTSMASPLVAGIAAQTWSADPKLTAVQVKQILLNTAKHSPALAGKVSSGGVVDAAAAVAAAAKELGPVQNKLP